MVKRRGETPLPIPNREIKLVSVDGTAFRGRVNNCHGRFIIFIFFNSYHHERKEVEIGVSMDFESPY